MEEGGGAREEERGRLGFVEAEGLDLSRGRGEQVEEGGPGARWPCRRLSARPTVTRTGWGPVSAREEREEAGLGCGLLLRAVVGDWAGPCGWPGCLPRVFLFFFLKTFFFFFSGFCRIRKRKGFWRGFLMELIFIKPPFQNVQITNIFGSEIFKIQ